MLYIVALPIGNPKDLTFRAAEVLGTVDYIACEDTREFGLLMESVNVKTTGKVVAYHEHNEDNSAKELIRLLKTGKSVAIVSDAGTPAISDPGFSILRLAYEESVPVIPIPGASSLTSALSITPIGGKTTLFLGFLPLKSRVEFLKEHISKADRIVFFEAPHRMVEVLEEILKNLGDLTISIHRELTKTFEENIYVKVSQALDHFSKSPPKGEFVVVLPRLDLPRLSQSELEAEIKKMMSENRKDSDISVLLSKQSDLSRKDIYKIILQIKGSRENTE